MATPRIGLFAPHTDAQAERLYAQIEALAPGACRRFALNLENGSPRVALSEAGVYWDGCDVAQLQCAYIHGFNYSNPILPDPLDDADWTLWQMDYLVKQQTISLIHSAFAEMQRRGVKLFNPPQCHVQNFMKPQLLEKIRQAGFNVPRLVVTNAADSAKTLADEINPLLWRPATGRAGWQLFGDRQRELLIAPDKPPVLLAEAVAGPLIRAYLFAGKPLFCLQYRVPAAQPLERLEVFQAIECPEVYGELQRLTETLALQWGLVLFVLKDGQPWIYDIDPDPLFKMLPELYQQQFAERLARGLLGEDLSGLAPLTQDPQPRPTLFLRRMLRVLFDIEALRHRPKS